MHERREREIPRTNEQYEQQQRELLERHSVQINASIIPETPGYVRTTGSRRQYRSEIRTGVLYIIEI